jgi:3-hydroxyacyl-CoA dehydrogenase
MMEYQQFRKVAVLGAGVMGAQIAAHLANAGLPVLLYDVVVGGEDKSALARKAIHHLLKLKPSPLGDPMLAQRITPCNYETDLSQLMACDFVIEAIAERRDWKESLYLQICGHLNDTCIFATNTSGLSIQQLATMLPLGLRERFCGVHFFNPPRYMPLVELIPSEYTQAKVLDHLETFLTTHLGKQVVRAKDTPNFIANRIGVFFMLSVFRHMEAFGLRFDEVDALTGPLIGHAKSATFRTLDIVGLDTMAHVIQTMTDHLSQDPWHGCYRLPEWLSYLIEQGYLGQKQGQGIYKKVGQSLYIFDRESKTYIPSDQGANATVQAIFAEKDLGKRFKALAAATDMQAQFLWAIYADLWQYAAYHSQEIAHTVRDIDMAMRFGFAWSEGPFETWQRAGGSSITALVDAAIYQGKTMCMAPLPLWVSQCHCFYQDDTAYAPETNSYLERRNLPVYHKQLFPLRLIQEMPATGHTMYENDGVRLWTLGDDIAILSFKSKKNTFNGSVITGVQQAIHYAEQHAKALVVWQSQGEHFSYGADLAFFGEEIKQDASRATAIVQEFQRMCLLMRYSRIPVIAAIRGLVLGGGCELVMHADARVAAFETYIGLVEAGVGLLPAGGGCKEFALKAVLHSPKDPMAKLSDYFRQIAMAEVSSSAIDAKKRGFLTDSDKIVMHPDEILFVAMAQAKLMSEMGYQPPVPSQFPAMGEAGIAMLEAQVLNLREGHFISTYDAEIASQVARVLCGGRLDTGSIVDEAWMLAREVEAFIELASNQKTQARIQHTLTTGKPLRN